MPGGEGILRRNLLTCTGQFRDSVHYSVLDSGWRGVKARLECFLARQPQ